MLRRRTPGRKANHLNPTGTTSILFHSNRIMKTLFLSPPSFDGFDGGAGSRYQARREVTSFWYPTWLAQPTALVPGAKLLDCPPPHIDIQQCLEQARHYDHVIVHTSTPSLKTIARSPKPSNRT